jgi:anaphase-promoting complex subunit 3
LAATLCQALPEKQQHTGWVLTQKGRAHFEMVQYADALRAFELAQVFQPHRDVAVTWP